MNLQHQLRVESLCSHTAVEPDHRDLHDVGRRALERSVLRHTLRVGAHTRVAGMDFRNRSLPPETRRDVAVPARPFDDSGESLAHAGELAEILLDELLG